jgi:Flp pilus assembly protein TadG
LIGAGLVLFALVAVSIVHRDRIYVYASRLAKGRSNDRGAAGLELIVLAPVVVALVVVSVAAAHAISAKTALISVAAGAARAAVDAPAANAGTAAQQAADDAAVGFGMDPARLTVSTSGTLTRGGTYTVVATYNVSLSPMPGSLTMTVTRSQPVDPFRGS